MSYSTIHNVDKSLRYEVRLNGETIRRGVPPHHIDSIVYELQNEGLFIEDETWDEEEMVVDLLAREEDLLDDMNEIVEESDY
jgi:hypothetical protein